MAEDSSEHRDHHYLNADRDRAALTRTDRELILGEKEYESEQALRNARYRVREHIRNSLLDIFLIANHYEQDELAKILQKHRERAEEEEDSPLALGQAAVTLGFRLEYATAMTVENRTFEDFIESAVVDGISATYKRVTDEKVITDINVDITVELEDVDQDRLIEELVFGEPGFRTFFSFLGKGDVELLRKKLRENEEVVDIAEEGWQSISPDDILFDAHTQEENSE